MSDVDLTERDEGGASVNLENVIPAVDAHSPNAQETQSQRASQEIRQNVASAHFRSSVPRPVDAPFGHQTQPLVLRQGDAPFGQSYGTHVPQRIFQPPLSAMTNPFLTHYPPSLDGNMESCH